MSDQIKSECSGISANAINQGIDCISLHSMFIDNNY